MTLRHLLPVLLGLSLVSLAPASRASDSGPGELTIRSTLPLDQTQRARLQAIVAADPEAKALFATLKAEAEGCLELTPQPLAVIHYEGLLNTDPKRIAAVARLTELDHAAVLLRYWQATDDARAASALRRQILAWARTYVPTGNDVNEAKLQPLFIAYDALRPSFEPEARTDVDAWIARLADLHLHHVKTSKQLSNRYTKSLRLVAVFGRILNRTDLVDAGTVGFRRFVAESLRADGTSYDLEQRDTLTYHNSALRPVIEIAVVSGTQGPALYAWTAPSGGSLKRSVDYVVPYASGEKQRQEWVNSRVKLDQQRADAGIEAYRKGRLFNPVDARDLLEEASYFDPSLVPLVLKLHGGGAKRFASWTMVVNAAALPDAPRR